MTTYNHAHPVKVRFWTWGTAILAVLTGIGLLFYLYRLIFGLEATTNLDNQYPWGIWIAIDVASGVALAAGGFTTAALADIFHKEKYHDIVRPALLTALLGYTFVVVGLLADLGRYYNVWHPLLPSMWQGNSVLFEVGLCVMIYLTVLYIEFLPIAVERFHGRVNLPKPLRFLNRFFESTLEVAGTNLRRFISIFIIAGVVLSCLHQSSLGTLMVIAKNKMHPIWYTPISPLLFLLSAIAVGFPMVIVESIAAARSFRLVPETKLLGSIAQYTPVLLGVYFGVRVIDLTLRDAWPYVFEGSAQSIMFLIEIGIGVVLPAILLLRRAVRRSVAGLFTSALLVVLGVVLNRINVFLVAYKPLYPIEPYFPSLMEIAVTVGLISALILVYRRFVMTFPVIAAHPAGGQPDLGVWLSDRPRRRFAIPRRLAIRRTLPPILALGLGWPLAGLAHDVPAHVHPMDGIDCRQCHTCDRPTIEQPCLIACPRLEAVNQTVPHNVSEAPDSVVLGQLANLYEPIKFNHKQHADMSKMGGDCATCHHYCPPGRIPSCSECHGTTTMETNLRMPSLKGAYHRQCLGCHREWTHDTKCVVCHVPHVGSDLDHANDATDILTVAHPMITEPDIELYHTPYEQAPVVTFFHKEHIDLFGLRCVDCHRQENCSRCHDLDKSAEKAAHSAEDTHALCNDCHRDDACSKCHDTRQRPSFQHASTGWALNRYHDKLDCRACHPGGQRIARLDQACSACHGGWNSKNFRHAVTGLQLDELHREIDCEDCHPERAFSVTPRCDGCHDDGRTPLNVPPGTRVAVKGE